MRWSSSDELRRAQYAFEASKLPQIIQEEEEEEDLSLRASALRSVCFVQSGGKLVLRFRHHYERKEASFV